MNTKQAAEIPPDLMQEILRIRAERGYSSNADAIRWALRFHMKCRENPIVAETEVIPEQEGYKIIVRNCAPEISAISIKRSQQPNSQEKENEEKC